VQGNRSHPPSPPPPSPHQPHKALGIHGQRMARAGGDGRDDDVGAASATTCRRGGRWRDAHGGKGGDALVCQLARVRDVLPRAPRATLAVLLAAARQHDAAARQCQRERVAGRHCSGVTKGWWVWSWWWWARKLPPPPFRPPLLALAPCWQGGSPLTCVHVVTGDDLPYPTPPHCPAAPSPATHTLPSAVTTRVCARPQATGTGGGGGERVQPT
jgi:hypothetical protein